MAAEGARVLFTAAAAVGLAVDLLLTPAHRGAPRVEVRPRRRSLHVLVHCRELVFLVQLGFVNPTGDGTIPLKKSMSTITKTFLFQVKQSQSQGVHTSKYHTKY